MGDDWGRRGLRYVIESPIPRVLKPRPRLSARTVCARRTADTTAPGTSPGRPWSVDRTHGRTTPAAHSTSARRRNSMNGAQCTYEWSPSANGHGWSRSRSLRPVLIPEHIAVSMRTRRVQKQWGGVPAGSELRTHVCVLHTAQK